LEQAGLALTNTAKHLGIHLAPTIEATVEATMAAIDPKAIERRILATTPPTDMLHRALLVNIAFTPIYNHVFMALPITSNYTDELQKAILKLLWTRQLEGQTKQKRRLVARNRLGAGLAMGGLGIQPIENTVEGFQQNLLQRIYKRVNQTASTSLLPSLLNRLLVRVHRPSLEDHVERLGPQQWETTAARLEQKNKMLAQYYDYMKWTKMGGTTLPSLATRKPAYSIRLPGRKLNCFGAGILLWFLNFLTQMS
jgi:hypothetical protein